MSWQPPSGLPDLRRAGAIALDIETKDDRLADELGSGWPFGAGYICGVSVAYRKDGAVRALYFPLRHPDSVNFDPAQVYQWVRDHVAADVRFVTQNGSYDWGWLRAEADIRMPPSERLEEIGATLVDENRHRYCLDTLRQVHKDTFFSHAQADADLEAQGRFKKVVATQVSGVPTYPARPASSPWARDPVPAEPPLNVDLDALPDMATASGLPPERAGDIEKGDVTADSPSTDELEARMAKIGEWAAKELRKRDQDVPQYGSNKDVPAHQP